MGEAITHLGVQGLCSAGSCPWDVPSSSWTDRTRVKPPLFHSLAMSQHTPTILGIGFLPCNVGKIMQLLSELQ
jgi:hypothetical protein